MGEIILYHGNDHVLKEPKYGYGKSDNDYGQGFYTTKDEERAMEWAIVNGNKEQSYVNTYTIDTTNVNVVNLDDYGILPWIAEIVCNRGTRSESSAILGEKLKNEYKIDLSRADIVVGYRADDSYLNIVDAFLQNQISVQETTSLLKIGNLGLQYFIKSQKAFKTLKYKENRVVHPNFTNMSEVNVRKEVIKFLQQRQNRIIVSGFQPTGILAREAVKNHYEYNKQYKYYNVIDVLENSEERKTIMINSLKDTGDGFPVAYHKDYLIGTMDLIRLVFVKMNEINHLNIYEQIDSYMQTSEIRKRMDEGNWSALMKGWIQVYNSVDLSICHVGEKTDLIMLHWLADIYTYWQWKYNLPSKEINSRCNTRTLSQLYYPLHEASIQKACEKLQHKFFELQRETEE